MCRYICVCVCVCVCDIVCVCRSYTVVNETFYTKFLVTKLISMLMHSRVVHALLDVEHTPQFGLVNSSG